MTTGLESSMGTNTGRYLGMDWLLLMRLSSNQPLPGLSMDIPDSGTEVQGVLP